MHVLGFHVKCSSNLGMVYLFIFTDGHVFLKYKTNKISGVHLTPAYSCFDDRLQTQTYSQLFLPD